jgi:hypothetical protein
MDGRALVDVGRELAAGSTEAHWRSSVGRAYYALLHEVLGALRRWGFALPPRDKVHTFARLKFVYATDPDLKQIGLTLEALGRLRNAADYKRGTPGPFSSPRIAAAALSDAGSAIALLDAIEADPARRAGAVRAIPLESRLTAASASGGVIVPVYAIRQNGTTADDMRLCGFAKEEGIGHSVLVPHADHIIADGTIR